MIVIHVDSHEHLSYNAALLVLNATQELLCDRFINDPRACDGNVIQLQLKIPFCHLDF